MRMIAVGCLYGGLLVGLICGTALAQNNPGGPPDQTGTANNIPTPTGTPGTFNTHTDAVTSSQGRSDTSNPASPPPLPGGIGTPPAAAPGAPGMGSTAPQ